MISTADLPQEEQQDIMDARTKALDALEARYAQPNWFKIAADFAKPQLGGFLASLGSAAQAQGETVEQQRALAPTVAVERAKLAQMESLMKKNERGANMAAGLLGISGPDAGRRILSSKNNLASYVTPENVAKIPGVIASLKASGQGEIAEGLRAGLDAFNSGTTTQATQIQSKIALTEAERKDPMMNLQMLLHSSQGKSPQEIAKIQSQIDSAIPPQVEPQFWATLSRAEKMQKQADYAKAQSEIGLGEEQQANAQAKSADVRLPLLVNIRELALGSGIPDVTTPKGEKITGQQQMAGLLNYFGGNDPVQVIARAAADGKFGELLAGIDTYARQNQMSPAARDKFQTLVKLLNENQVSLRGSSLNPTDAFTSMQTAASPNIGNSQKALVTLVDLIGHSEKHAQDRAKYISTAGVSGRMLRFDPKYEDFQRKYNEEHRGIIKADPTVTTPSWYGPPPSAGNTVRPAANVNTNASSGERPNERTMGGVTYVRQPDGSYRQKAQ
jgi:hypothetical protein